MDNDRAQQWIRDHAPSLHCPACGQRSFNLDNMIVITNSLQPEGHIDYLSGIPLVAVVCQGCAHVMFFAAKQMGAL